MVLYIERWLKAPVQEEDGQLVPREKGTPQGGVISPLLANLFLHYAFDRWMAKRYPQLPFERFADDAIVHCRTERKPRKFGQRSPHDCGNVGWSFIRRRRRLSIVRMMIGGGRTCTRSSIFWAIHFGRGDRRIGRGSTSSTSVRQFLTRR